MAPPVKRPPPEEAPELFANGDANSGPFKLMVRVVVVVVVVICHLQTGHPNCHQKGLFRRSLHQTAHQTWHLRFSSLFSLNIFDDHGDKNMIVLHDKTM